MRGLRRWVFLLSWGGVTGACARMPAPVGPAFEPSSVPIAVPLIPGPSSSSAPVEPTSEPSSEPAHLVPIGLLMGTGWPGFSGDGGPALFASLDQPGGVAVRRGEILVSDSANHRIRKIDGDGLASTWLGPDPTIVPALVGPGRIVADDLTGLVFFSEPAHGLVRCVDTEGRVVTVLGGGTLGPGEAGEGSSGRDIALVEPGGLALDGLGHLFVADAGQHVVWRVDLDAGWRARCWAGTGRAGGLGDGGLAVEGELDGPVDVAIAPDGCLLVAERDGHRVRRVRTDGRLERVAGTGLPGRDPDGLASLGSRLRSPTGLMVDPRGVIWIADRGNSRLVRLDENGLLSTVMTDVVNPAILAAGPDDEILVVDPVMHQLHANSRDRLAPVSAGL